MSILTNPFPKAPESGRIQVDTDPELFDNLFKRLLASEKGTKAAIVNTLLKKFYDEVVAQNIPFSYDIDNESRLADILSRCNFKPSNGNKSARPRRANPSTVVNPAQPAGQGHDPGSTHCTSD